MSVRFCSDLHIGHRLACKQRGFEDNIEEHDNAVIESIATGTSKKSLTYILGDVCMGPDPARLKRLLEIKGRLILIRGNHDTFKLKEYLKYFEEIYGIIKYKNFWVTHCPIHPQEMYRCIGNIHGHIHKNSLSSELDKPYLNVNWDYLRGVITLDEIKKEFNVPF